MTTRIMMAAFAGLAALALAGCDTTSQSDRALGGAALGAGTGAVIGGLASNSVGGAAVGAVVGGATGAIIGSATTPKNCVATDRNGRRFYVACP